MQKVKIRFCMFKRCMLLASVLFLLIAGTAGCSPSGTGSTQGINGTTDKGTIGLLWNTMQVQVCVAQLNAAKERVKELGYNYVEFDANWDVAKQQNGMENMISQKVKAIVMIAADGKGIIPAVEKANAAGIPVVTQDNTSDGGKIFDFIATDNYLAGKYCAEYIVWKLKGKGNVAVLGTKTVTAGATRYKALMDVWRHYPDIHIVADQEAFDTPTGIEKMSYVLQANKQIDAVYCVNDPCALGAERAITAAKRENEMFIVTVDGSPEVVEKVRGGQSPIQMTIAQFPRELSFNAVDAAVAAIEGRKPITNPLPADPNDNSPVFYTNIFPITKDNVSEFNGWDAPAPKYVSPPWWK